MTETRKPHVYVEGFEEDGSGPDVSATYVVLQVHYDHKKARIELPVGERLFPSELQTEVYRRGLDELLKALQEVVTSPQGIL